jgi:diguanylate cyclase (GGDEF)-like protein
MFIYLVSFASVLSLPAHAKTHDLRTISDHQIEVLIDPEHRLTVQDVINQKNLNWAISEQGIPSYGFSPHTYWFRFLIPTQDNESLLELDYALLDDISYYRLLNDKIIETIFTGDKRNFSERPIKHRAFLFPIPSSNQDQVVLIKIRSSSAIQLPLTLWPEKTFFEQDQYHFVEHGLYYGIVLVMALYNLFLFFRLRDSAYAFYVLYVSIFALAQLSLSGFAYQFLWPNLPEWNEKSLAVFTPLGLVSALVFVNNFLKLDVFHPRIYKFILVQAFVGLLIAALSIVFSYHIMIPYVAGLAIVTCLTTLIISYYITFNRIYKYAIYFSAAWTVLLVGIVILALNKFGFIPRTNITESAAQIGSAIEIILLSFALAERLYDAMQRHFIAEKESIHIKEELIQTQQKQNQELESEVESRTHDLQLALAKVKTLNNELSDLSTMDQVTGVRNRRYFDDMLDKEFQRASRNRSKLSLIMVDLDHFKKVNDNYGHLAGDLSLKTVANAMYHIVQRPPDLVCRYGGEELAIIMPETDHDGAMKIAERIRHQIENLHIEFANQRIYITASLGVASFIPNNNITPSLLIELADKALYTAKHNGRNRIESAA